MGEQIFLTVQNVHLDGLGLTAGRAALVPAVVRIGSFLNQQVAGGRIAFFGDHVHAAPRRLVTDHLHEENTSSFSSLAHPMRPFAFAHLVLRATLQSGRNFPKRRERESGRRTARAYTHDW